MSTVNLAKAVRWPRGFVLAVLWWSYLRRELGRRLRKQTQASLCYIIKQAALLNGVVIQNHRRFCILFFLLVVLLGAPILALADSDTDQLFVSVNVKSGCSLNGGTMDFGEYISGQPNDLDIIGHINFVDCSGYMMLSLDGGSSGSVTNRHMTLGDHQLKYQLYRSPTRTAIWGDGADVREVTLLGPPQSESIDVYGRIPKLQVVPDGLYTDTITITLTF